MIEINLKTLTFMRIAGVITPSTKQDLKYVLIEIKNNNITLIATNQRVCVAEKVAETDESDGFYHVAIDDSLLENLKNSESLKITIIPELCYADIETDTGFKEDSCFKWIDKSFLHFWRQWVVEHDSQQGFMYIDIYQIQKMFEASLSGRIVFPEVIDSSKPVTVRDVDNPDWLGVFIPQYEGKTKLKCATIPEWALNEGKND